MAKALQKLNDRQFAQVNFFYGVVGALSAQALYDTFEKAYDFYLPKSPPWTGVGFGYGVSVALIGIIFLGIYQRDDRAEKKYKWTYQGPVEPAARLNQTPTNRAGTPAAAAPVTPASPPAPATGAQHPGGAAPSKSRDVRLMLFGVVFGILAQALYDTGTTAVGTYVPLLSKSWDQAAAAGIVVALLYFLVIKRIRD